ncbi:MAG: GtrA family protein [Clostridiales bacterium]|nr:GtrA family protein [Clostridiales bacterium]
MKNLIRKFYNKEVISYLFFGVLTTLVNFFVFELARFYGFHYSTSTIIAWIISVIFAYITNKVFVFESKNFKLNTIAKEGLSFIGFRIISGLCDLAFMVFAVEIITMNDSIAKLVANVFVVIMNYVFSKLFIFKKL